MAAAGKPVPIQILKRYSRRKKTTTRSCEASGASFSSLSQPGNPQTGAAVFLGFDAQSSGPKNIMETTGFRSVSVLLHRKEEAVATKQQNH